MNRSIDLNADVGERPEAITDGSEDRLIGVVTSVNIACGEHAGDEDTMDAVVRIARHHRVAVGAHPGYPDREHFGRKELALSREDLETAVFRQIRALGRIALSLRSELYHVKPHGALYHAIRRDPVIAEIFSRGVGRVSKDLVLVGMAGSTTLELWRQLGFRVLSEAFADRAYEPNGELRPRDLEGAVLTDPDRASEQALQIARDKEVTTVDGSRLVVKASTLCLHSDIPNAVEIGRTVRTVLESAGVSIRRPEV